MAANAGAQCEARWLPGEGIPGLDDSAFATIHWDPDGAGPVTPKLVVAGRFGVAGTAVAERIAAWDPNAGTWSAFGAGMEGEVYCLAVLPSGDLVAGGAFWKAGGISASGVAVWRLWGPAIWGATLPSWTVIRAA